MEWSADLLGLSPAFTNAFGVGGGCIQVNIFVFLKLFLTGTTIKVLSIRICSRGYCVAARSSYMRDHPVTKLEDLVIYASSQTHSLGSKAGLVLGIQVLAIEISYDDELMLRGKALCDALEEDLKLGFKPFILSNFFFIVRDSFHVTYFLCSPVANVGTTSSGAIDNTSEIKVVGTNVYSFFYM